LKQKDNRVKTVNLLGLVALVAGVCAAAPGGAATLKIGDAAPPLRTGKWLQGEPVAGFDDQHVYVVEFWAAWNPLCRAPIPYLSEISQKFKAQGVIVIGQDVAERDESAAAAFLKEWGGQLTYRVALDDKSQNTNGAMAVTWMLAAGQSGLPTVFVVNRHGRIAWIGPPQALPEAVLQQILDDQFDVAGYARKFEQQQQEQALRLALFQNLDQFLMAKNWSAAEAAVTEIEKTVPETERYRLSVARLRILVGRQELARACQLAKATSDAHTENANLQNDLAWYLSTAKGLEAEQCMLAEEIAGRANSAARGKNPEILDTLARLQFLSGQTNEAVANEQIAVAVAPETTRKYYQSCLTNLVRGKLPKGGE
jgi:thiol-disulfide isomerase/thioredoxin